MAADFEHKMERSDGGNPISLRVTDNQVTLTIPPPVKENEIDAVKGLGELATALKKKLGTVTASPEASEITIATNARDPALGIVIAQILEANGIIKPGKAKEFEQAIDAAEHAPSQQVAQQAAPSHSLEDIKKAMQSVVVPAETYASTHTPGAERGPRGVA